MRSKNDHEIKFTGDAELYLALKVLADEDDRSLSDYLRHVLRRHVRDAVLAMSYAKSSPNLGRVMAETGLNQAEFGAEIDPQDTHQSA